jgi:hypothetical protein
MKKEKAKKKRANNYEKPLKINGTFEQAIKELVEKPKPKTEK